jgi:hypothetical protein
VNMMFGVSSPIGEPRLRLEIVLRLKPDILGELRLAGQDELNAIVTRLERAVEINFAEAELVSTSSQGYREAPPPPDPTSMYRDLMDRLPFKKREPWEDPPP